MIKVAVTGPESTGKSMLAEDLAKAYNTIFVPEFAREYLENLNRPYEIHDVVEIAGGQLRLENEAARRHPEVLFCDTDLTVCKIWCEVKYGRCPDEITQWIEAEDYDFFLLCNTDVPWAYDPLREHPHLREHLFSLYLAEMKTKKAPFGIVSGTGPQRLASAIGWLMRFFPHLPHPA